MRINFDVRNALNEGGIGAYKKHLSLELSKQEGVEIVGCCNFQRNVKLRMHQTFNFPITISIIPDRLAYGNYDLPISYELMMNRTADLNYFGTYFLPRVKFRKPLISTIHDIIVLKTNLESPAFIESHRSQLLHTVKLSQYVFTISQKSKEDIVDMFNIDPDKVHIVHNGVDIKWPKNVNSNQERLTQKYNLPERYILYLGQYRKHKNVERLLQAYSLLPIIVRKELKLVVTCKIPELVKLAYDLKIYEDIVFTGYIDTEDKPFLYKMADMVYYASLYEGFGVPIIEAQACGSPVITSNTSSMPEASGGFAELVDPNSTDDIYQAILELHNNSFRRNYLIENGYKNANLYTWQKSGKELYEFLQNI